jgi:hypothetical protein
VQDRNHQYHRIAAYVYAGRWVLKHRSLWDGVEAAECMGIELGQIGHNWSATVVALAFRNFATLRALIDEA